MTKEFIIEMVGYAGSFLVLVSFLMTSVAKLRIVNTIGSIIFMIYALIIRSYPTAVMNFCLVLINLHFLWKMSRMGKEYSMVDVRVTDGFLRYLLDYYMEDIEKCFPGIDLSFQPDDLGFIITCGEKPVGITIGRGSRKEMELLLDYSIPEYRDFSIGSFLMNSLKKSGYHTLIYRGPSSHHREYLEKMNFTETENGFVKEL